MSFLITFFLGPIGRWVGIGLIASAVFFGWGEKRYWDGRSSYKAKIEREKNEAIANGNQGGADALSKLDSDSLPNSWWRD